MERAAHAVLDAAYERGVRHFDAARSYGRAEAFLSSWLRARGLRRDEVVVSSKWGYEYTAGWRVDAEHHEIKELSAERLRTPVGRVAGAAGRVARALPDPLRDARQRRARRPGRARAARRDPRGRRPRRALGHRRRPGGDDRPRGGGRRLRRGPGDVEPARAQRGRRARPRARRRDAGLRQGGAGERAAHRPRRAAGARSPRRRSAGSRRTRSRSRRCSRSRGRTWCSAARRRWRSSRATSPRRAWRGTRRSSGGWPGWPRSPGRTGSGGPRSRGTDAAPGRTSALKGARSAAAGCVAVSGAHTATSTQRNGPPARLLRCVASHSRIPGVSRNATQRPRRLRPSCQCRSSSRRYRADGGSTQPLRPKSRWSGGSNASDPARDRRRHDRGDRPELEPGHAPPVAPRALLLRQRLGPEQPLDLRRREPQPALPAPRRRLVRAAHRHDLRPVGGGEPLGAGGVRARQDEQRVGPRPLGAQPLAVDLDRARELHHARGPPSASRAPSAPPCGPGARRGSRTRSRPPARGAPGRSRTAR